MTGDHVTRILLVDVPLLAVILVGALGLTVGSAFAPDTKQKEAVHTTASASKLLKRNKTSLNLCRQALKMLGVFVREKYFTRPAVGVVVVQRE